MTLGQLRLVLDAACFAAQKHRDQRRKGKGKPPYINHPLEVARLLSEAGGVKDAKLIAAALLHDTIEDTKTTRQELARKFGKRVASLVAEVTDDKSLPKQTRKRLQVEHAPQLSRGAKQIKLADKISNLREITENPPAKWSVKRKREYFDWGKEVVDRIRDANPRLAREFDAAYARRTRL